MEESRKAPAELEQAQKAASDYRRAAALAATGTAELAETLKVCDDARRKLQDALEACVGRLEALRRRSEELEKRAQAAEADRDQVALAAKDAMAAAEAVRREGIEALEEARLLHKKK